MAFRTKFLANIVDYASHRGVNVNELLSIIGLSYNELEEESLTVDSSTYSKVLEKIVEETNDRFFGLHFGESLSLSAAGVIVQIVQSSRTIKEALGYMVEFANLGCQEMPFKLEELDNEWRLSLHPSKLWIKQSPVAVKQTMDGIVIFTLREISTLTRSKHNPLRLDFDYERPKSLGEYNRIFKCPINFNQPYTAFFFDKKQVERPIVTSDYDLLKVLVDYANERLSNTRVVRTYEITVRDSILGLMNPAFPSIIQVASNLNTSVRTLQRRLSKEGTTFKSVTDLLRMELAKDYVLNKELSIKQITYLLGYMDPSSFIRAFKRWYAQSPEKYRWTENL